MMKLILCGLFCLVSINVISANSEPNQQDECPTICALIYSPVCATDGQGYQEFSNPCELNARNCQRKREDLKPLTKTDEAWCSSTFVENLLEKISVEASEAECLKPCPMIYSPVCATNGQLRATLSNNCEMEYFNCLIGSKVNSKRFRVLKPEVC